MSYVSWRLFDEVIIVVNSFGQGYVVDPANKKQLDTAMRWAEKHSTKAPEVIRTANKDFELSLYDCAEHSSCGGKLSFWNCKIEKDGKSYIIGINTDSLLSLMKHSTFVNGKCQNKLFFAKQAGNTCLIHTGMQEYDEAVKSIKLKKDLSTKKTKNWQVGKNYVTATCNDLYLGEIYVPIFTRESSSSYDAGIFDSLPEEVRDYLFDNMDIKSIQYYSRYAHILKIHVDKTYKRKVKALTYDMPDFVKATGVESEKDLTWDKLFKTLKKSMKDIRSYFAKLKEEQNGRFNWDFVTEACYRNNVFIENCITRDDDSQKMPARQQGQIDLGVGENYNEQVQELLDTSKEVYLQLIKDGIECGITLGNIGNLVRSTNGEITDLDIEIIKKVFEGIEKQVQELLEEKNQKSLFILVHDEVEEYIYDTEEARDRLIEVLRK